ncbi:MAG: hypothetical protein ACREI3_09515 [Nitrospirales bacterium]
MSIRKACGDWEPLLLANQDRKCGVCGNVLWRNVTFFRGGWARCTICEKFVHYGCLASGRVKFLKARPRVCKVCRVQQERGATAQPAGTALAS